MVYVECIIALKSNSIHANTNKKFCTYIWSNKLKFVSWSLRKNAWNLFIAHTDLACTLMYICIVPNRYNMLYILYTCVFYKWSTRRAEYTNHYRTDLRKRLAQTYYFLQCMKLIETTRYFMPYFYFFIIYMLHFNCFYLIETLVALLHVFECCLKIE